MLYFWQMPPDGLDSQVAVNTDNIADLQRESERSRERIHAVESSVYAVKVLTKAVEDLQESMPTLARRVAKEVIAEDRRIRHRDWWAYARTYIALVTAGIALGALIVGLVLR